MRLTTLLLFLIGSQVAFSQSDITLEDIWQNHAFYSKSVPGFNFMNNGKHYTRLEDGKIKKYHIETGKETDVLLDTEVLKSENGFNGTIDSYKFSDDESKFIVKSETEAIYRRSTKAIFYVYDRGTKSLTKVREGDKVRYCTFSPDASKVAYVFENNMYYKDLRTGQATQISDDGEYNKIINGSADWVYEEEFSISKAFQWSPAGDKIAFIRYDESAVSEFTMTNYHDGLYPEYETYKYPKVGEDNALVSVHIFDLGRKNTTKVDLGDLSEMYIPRVRWTQSNDELCIYKMNRHQNELDLLVYNFQNTQSRTLLQEKNNSYLDITDDLTFLKDKRHFVWTSESDGYNHIYLYDMKGRLKRQLTKGDYDVTAFYGVDEKRGQVYFQAAQNSPLNREVYSVSLKGGIWRRFSTQEGSNSAQFSSTYDYYINTFSTANTPPTYTVYTHGKKKVRIIEANKPITAKQKNHNVSSLEFFDIPIEDGIKLNAWMIRPADFNPKKEYPVLMYVYGGPGSQTVTNSWKGNNYWWYQLLAQNGYIIVSVDNRGTGARGENFKKMTYLELGKYETMDQISSAKHLAALPYVDGDRIGIWGWSYGGYMSSNCILKGSDIFKAAIAVAPVTNWKWYDTIYTERYMRTLEENEAGYRDNSPIYFADKLKGAYLLVHGVSDDNVHFQHTAEMARALISANKQFDTYFYPNRNHGIYGDNARIHLYTKMTDFIKQNL